MRFPFGKGAKIGVAVLAVILATMAYDTRWGTPACDATTTGFPLKPKMIYGLSIGFEPWVKSAFPIGTCEADFIAWMDRLEFDKVTKSSAVSHVTDTEEEFAREEERRAKGQLFKRRTLSQKAPIGNSYFTLAWNSDEHGRITEMFAYAELMHFYLP